MAMGTIETDLAAPRQGVGAAAIPAVAPGTQPATAFWQPAAREVGLADDRLCGWTLSGSFQVGDGVDEDSDGALNLSVWFGDKVAPFPDDQRYAELSAAGPVLDGAAGPRRVTFVSDRADAARRLGVPCAVLHPGPDSRLQQALDLRKAAGPRVLRWIGTQQVCGSHFTGEPFFLQLVLRNPAGALLETLYRYDATGTTGCWGRADLSAYAGQMVQLSFEQRAAWSDTMIDCVSVSNGWTEFVVNGDFTQGSEGWTVPAEAVSTQVGSGPRRLGGLTVQRWFHAPPEQRWVRMVDVFHNPGDAPVNAMAIYHSDAGARGAGCLYPTPGTAGRAITVSSGCPHGIDRGFVSGLVDGRSYTEGDGWLAGSGVRNEIFFKHDISVPPRGQVTLVNFLIQVPGAPSPAGRAPRVDAIAAVMASDFRHNPQFGRGMTPSQLATLQNF